MNQLKDLRAREGEDSMIYTRFGTPVTIVGRDSTGEWLTVQYQDGVRREVLFCDLRADGGAAEVARAAARAPEIVQDEGDAR